MTKSEVRFRASRYGFRLQRHEVDGAVLWEWRRGHNVHDWPQFLDETAAVSWMEHEIRSGTLFNH